MVLVPFDEHITFEGLKKKMQIMHHSLPYSRENYIADITQASNQNNRNVYHFFFICDRFSQIRNNHQNYKQFNGSNAVKQY